MVVVVRAVVVVVVVGRGVVENLRMKWGFGENLTVDGLAVVVVLGISLMMSCGYSLGVVCGASVVVVVVVVGGSLEGTGSYVS